MKRMFSGAVLFASLCGLASAAEQKIESAAIGGLSANDPVKLDVNYSTMDPLGDHVIGLGVRLHWDSSKLEFNQVTEVLQDFLLAEGEPENDLDDLDGDPTTDTFINYLWVDFRGEWLKTREPPKRLYTVLFSPKAGYSPSTPTTINYTASSTAMGYSLRAASLGLPADGGGIFGDGFE